MVFRIERMEEGKPTGTFLPEEFENPQNAASLAADKNAAEKAQGTKTRWKIVKQNPGASTGPEMGPEDDWRGRERARLESGEYTPVPWSGEEWFLTSDHAGNHFPHISVNDPGKIAFTESPEKGAADIQLRLKAGKYLTRYFSDRLTGREIRHWASRVNLETGGFSVAIATTPEEITRIYQNGPSSCMSGDSDEFNTDGVHPASVYGAGDLGVAYLESDDGDISCRAICWPKNKTFGRVYGDGGEYESEFRDNLERMGYCKSDDFTGARLLRIKSGYDHFVCPYLDHAHSVSDNGEYLIYGGSGYDAHRTDGLCGSDGDTECANCGDNFDSDCEGGNVQGDSWCEHCIQEYSSYCEDCEESYHYDRIQYVESVSRSVCDYCLESNYTRCKECGEYGRDSDSLVTQSGDSVCQTCAEDNYSVCEECAELAPHDETREIKDSYYCESCAEEKTQDCEECQESTPKEDLTNYHGESLCESCLDDKKENEPELELESENE